MRLFFTLTLLVLAALSLIAWKIQPRPVDGKLPLTWVSDDNPARREQVALFNRLHPQYHLRLDPSNSGMEKVIVQSLAGVGPDLFDCYGGQLSSYVKAGIAWDVTGELARSGINIRKDIWPSVYPTITYEGRVYGFPTNVAVDALWYNKEIFDRAGIPYPRGPWTWEEFIPLAQRLTLRDPDGRVRQFGFLCDWWNWQQFVYQWGGRLYSENGTRCTIDSPQAIAAVQFMQDLIYRYRVMPSPVEQAAMASQGGWGSGTINQFGARKAAMAMGGRWWLCTLRANKDLRLGAVECPHGPRRVFYAYPRATLVNRNSSRREAALAFLKYEASREYNELINHQADALAPVVRHCFTPQFLHDPAFPQEDHNRVWRDIMEFAEPDQSSPFVTHQVANRILTRQLDLVKANQKSPAEAMKTAAREINEEIRKAVERDPQLRARYQALTGGSPS